MVVIDTNVAIERIRKGEEIDESITGVTFVEFPRIVRYSRFKGDVLFPNLDDYLLAHELQEKLLKRGSPRGFADLHFSFESLAVHGGDATNNPTGLQTRKRHSFKA